MQGMVRSAWCEFRCVRGADCKRYDLQGVIDTGCIKCRV